MDDLVQMQLDKMLAEEDCSSITLNTILKNLEVIFGRIIVQPEKDAIADYVMCSMEDKLPGESNHVDEECDSQFAATPKKKITKRSVFNRSYSLSKPLEELVGTSECSRPELVKKIWAYVKMHDLQDPKDRRFILSDEKLIKVFKKKRINCFSMNRDLSKHIFKSDDVSKATATTDISLVEKMNDKLLALPNELLALNCFEEPMMTYSDIQSAFLRYIDDFRSLEDPDMVNLPSPEHELSVFFDERQQSLHLLELMKKLRYFLTSELRKIYPEIARQDNYSNQNK